MLARNDSRVSPAHTKGVISLPVTLLATFAMLAMYTDRITAQKGGVLATAHEAVLPYLFQRTSLSAQNLMPGAHLRYPE